MIPYSLSEEKEFLLRYAEMLGDSAAKEIVQRDAITSKDEAIHFAEFFWNAVGLSNREDEKSGSSSEYILEKIIITLMAYFRSAGFSDEWELVVDRR